MTNQEAIEIYKDLWRYEHSNFSEKEIREALEKGIEALEKQSSVIEELKKLKTEIEKLEYDDFDCNLVLPAWEVYAIIDSYIEKLKGGK